MMNEQKYTPGKWRIADFANENIFQDVISLEVVDKRGFPIAEFPTAPILHNWYKKFPKMKHWADGVDDGRTQIRRPDSEVIANARLFVAAPALLAALKAARAHCDCSDYNGKALIPCTDEKPCAGCYTVRKIDAAIAQAEEEV